MFLNRFSLVFFNKITIFDYLDRCSLIIRIHHNQLRNKHTYEEISQFIDNLEYIVF